MAKNYYLVLVAGGLGTRMQNKKPKQLLKVNNKPIFVLALQQFFKSFPKIKVVIAAHADFLNEIKSIAKSNFPSKEIQIVKGGATRFDSVKNALSKIEDANAVVGIHDAARPFVNTDVIKLCFKTAEEKGNAIPVISISESLRKITRSGSKALNRDSYRIIQTPQCFSNKLLKKAFRKKYSAEFTDDATVVESLGVKINLVEGNLENIKITHPQDITKAKFLIQYVK